MRVTGPCSCAPFFFRHFMSCFLGRGQFVSLHGNRVVRYYDVIAQVEAVRVDT
jgi:hypothetical protein